MLKPRVTIAGLQRYRSPITSREGLSLDLNESMPGCSPRVLARLHSLSAKDVSLYPQREAGERLVADFLGIAPEQALVTNGMDEALSLVFTAYLDSGDELLFADPTFVMYPMLGATVAAKVVRVPSRENLTLPIAELLARISPRTRVIAIANPNNPTGLAATRADLLKIVESAPNAAVLIDEAYFEFCSGALTCRTLIPDLAHHPNLFVARTFSKAYGLAGLRLGVLTGAAEQIDYLRRLSLPFNVNSVALACLEEALADRSFVSEHVAQIKRGREQLERLFGELGLHFWPSQTNFVLLRMGDSAKAFVEAMRRRRIVVRDFSASPCCQGCVRITVGTPKQMDTVLTAIRDSFAESRRA
ncbi:MAG TPA: histidinol-phosphate transaminase [Terriglobales bacterium]|jgi:histidinol-phosphate aminotransferase|nr:histidinol-phosphate transaminase [Terriglobales bacterium]